MYLKNIDIQKYATLLDATYITSNFFQSAGFDKLTIS
jgi:hypothetical protein